MVDDGRGAGPRDRPDGLRQPEGDELDPVADTGRFQAFVDQPDEPGAGGASRSGTRFRMVTLLVGLAAFAAIVALLLSG